MGACVMTSMHKGNGRHPCIVVGYDGSPCGRAAVALEHDAVERKRSHAAAG
jgi:hypothetical protein